MSKGLEEGGTCAANSSISPSLARFPDSPEEVELGREVVVHRPPADTGPLEDLLDRDLVKVALDEEIARRRETSASRAPLLGRPLRASPLSTLTAALHRRIVYYRLMVGKWPNPT